MDELKDTENQEVEKKVSAKDKWNENFKNRHADIDPTDEEAYYSAINSDYDDYADMGERLKGVEADNQEIADMLEKYPAFAEMLVSIAGKNGNPWQALARYGGKDVMDLLADPDNEELAQQVMDAQNEYAENIKRSKELREQAAKNCGPTVENMLRVKEKRGMSDEQAQQMVDLWGKIHKGALVDDVDEETWDIIADHIMHDQDVSAAAAEGEMKGRTAKMEVEKNHMLKGGNPVAMRGQGGGPRKNAKDRSAMMVSSTPWFERDNEEA